VGSRADSTNLVSRLTAVLENCEVRISGLEFHISRCLHSCVPMSKRCKVPANLPGAALHVAAILMSGVLNV